MQVIKLDEAGYSSALVGLGKSYKQPFGKMHDVADRNKDKDGGHNKFLEHIVTWWDITMPRSWWAQFDTYRVAVSKQSGSTMHTLKRDGLCPDDFDCEIQSDAVLVINEMIQDGADIEHIKNELPEGFLQDREVVLSYATLRNIIIQRRDHKLAGAWGYFCQAIIDQVDYPDLLPLVGRDRTAAWLNYTEMLEGKRQWPEQAGRVMMSHAKILERMGMSADKRQAFMRDIIDAVLQSNAI